MRRISSILLLAAAWSASAQDRNHARSMVYSEQGIVATSQTLASQAGATILARGGSAVDAAIAANAVLGVVEPMMNGIGGDLLAIHADAKTGKLTGLNSSGWAPRGMTIEALRAKGHTGMPQSGIDSATVPGCVEGWAKLHGKFGKLPWRDLFAPAIYYAERGFPVTELIAAQWAAATAKLSADTVAREVFLMSGQAPAVGTLFRNPALGKALRHIAEQGAAAFYKGPVAAAVLKTSARLGGTMTAADLAEFQAEWVEPVSSSYRGWTVYELPPNSMGVGALEMLNIMEQFPLGSHDGSSTEAMHYKIEAQKLAYADLRKYLADPRFAKVPVSGLLAKPYAAGRAKLIDSNRANCAPSAGMPLGPVSDTIYLSAVDREGNIVSLIQSIYVSFGSGVGVDGMGFVLHNRGGLFDFDPQKPNALTPRKRPFHTIIPAAMRKGSVTMGFGIMGGLNQAQAHAQFVSNIADYGMNAQAALEAPRFYKSTFGGCDVSIESRVPEKTREALAAKGHLIDLRGAYSSHMGGGQAVAYDAKTGVKSGASSPRKDGAAIPEPAVYESIWKPAAR